MRLKLSLRIPTGCMPLALGISLLATCSAAAQDKITTTDGRTQDVKVIGSTPASIQVRIGTGTVAIPANTVTAVAMAAPAEFTSGTTAYDAGDYPKALASIEAVVTQFKGLRTEWAEEAAGLLGDIDAVMGKMPEAEAAYSELQKIYSSQSSIRAEVGMARIALSKKDYEGARQKLEPITAQALKEKHPASAVAPAYSQAFYLMGEICEAQRDYPAALENYLRTVVLFYADRTAVAAAQQKADDLRKNHGVTVP